MRYIYRLALLLAPLLFASSAFSQTTLVSGSATDASAQTWNDGTYSFFFVPAPGNPGPYRWNGAPFNTAQVISGVLNGAGLFVNAPVPSNTFITPGGSKWRLQVCPAATFPCSSFEMTVTGATQTANVVPPTIAINLTSPGPFTKAYSDSEIVSAVVAAKYYNLTTQRERICKVVSGQTCTTWADLGFGAGGDVNPSTALATAYYNTSTTINGIPGSPPTVNGSYLCGYNVSASVAVVPTCEQVGLGPRSATGATDTILFTDNNSIVEYQGVVSVAVSLPTPTTLTNASFFTALNNRTTGVGTNVTVTPTTFTINGAATLIITQGQQCLILVDPSLATNWLSSCTGGGAAFPRLDQVLNPTADKTFAMGGHSLNFDNIGPGRIQFNAVVSDSAIGSDNVNIFSTAIHTSGILNNLPALSVGNGANGNGGTTTLLNPLDVYADVTNGAAVIDVMNLRVEATGIFGGGSSAQNIYGLWIGDQVGAAAGNWAIKTGLGLVQFGDAIIGSTTGDSGDANLLSCETSTNTGGTVNCLTITSHSPSGGGNAHGLVVNAANTEATGDAIGASILSVTSGAKNSTALTLSATSDTGNTVALDLSAGSLTLAGLPGTPGQVLTSAGTGLTPTWTTPATAVTNFPSNVGTDTKTSQVAAIGSTTLLTTGGSNAAYMAVVTLNCDTTSAAATVNVTLGWTDPGSQAQTQSLGSAIVCTALGSNSMGGFTFPFRAKASTTITYSTNIVNTPTYDISLVIYKVTAN